MWLNEDDCVGDDDKTQAVRREQTTSGCSAFARESLEGSRSGFRIAKGGQPASQPASPCSDSFVRDRGDQVRLVGLCRCFVLGGEG